MADTHGNTPDPLIEELVQRPWAFDFFHAVRWLESQRPDRPRIGYSISPSEDPVRFWQRPSLRFAPSALDFVEANGPGGVPRIAVNFFGLFGPNAPLPPHITEYALERELHSPRDHTITAFFNLFHHRLLCFFYRAWAANQKAVDLDRPAEQHFATYLGSLFGIGMETLQERDAVPDRAKLFFAGRLSCQTRNAEGLEAILREYFHIPAEVQQFIGRWLALPGDSRFQLGVTPESGVLGENTILGSRFWDSQLSFRMRFGPMSLADYIRMLPPEESRRTGTADGATGAGNGGLSADGTNQPWDQPATHGEVGASHQPAGSHGAANYGDGGAGYGYGGAVHSQGAASPGQLAGGHTATSPGQSAGSRAGDFGRAGAGNEGVQGGSSGGENSGRAGADANAGSPGFPGAGGQPDEFGAGGLAGESWSNRATLPPGVGGGSGGSTSAFGAAGAAGVGATGAGAAPGEPSFAELLRTHTVASTANDPQGGGVRSGLASGTQAHPSRPSDAAARRGGPAPIPTVRRGEAFQRVKYWVMNYCGDHFFWDAQLVLRAEEVPEVCLGRAGWLGYTTWLKTKPFASDADHLILNPPPDQRATEQ